MNLQKIKDFIFHNIGYIALYMSGLPLLTFLLSIFFKYLSSITLFDTLYMLQIGRVELVYLKNSFFSFSYTIGNTTRTWPALTYIFMFLFLASAILYLVSKKKENRLLDFAFMVVFIAQIVISIRLLLILFFLGDPLFSTTVTSIALFKCFLSIFISYTYLQRSFREKQLVPLDDPDGIKIYLNDDRFAETLHHERASKGQRFINYIIDIFIIIAIFSGYIFLLPRTLTRTLSNTFGDDFSVYILFFVASTFYYLCFESIFKTTPGKCLTNTRIINYKKGKIYFSQFLWRTFSRRIPFEAFSFFGSIGWHDLISTTTVVKQTAEKKYNRSKNMILIGIGLMILFIVMRNILETF